MPKPGEKFKISIKDWLGFAPGYYDTDFFLTTGSLGHARSMTAVNLFQPHALTQGDGFTTLTNGNENGAVTTLITSILKHGVGTTVTYAGGGNLLYKLDANTVTNAGIWPHTIDHPSKTSENVTSLIYYEGDLYYLYSHSTGSDIGKYDLGSTFDDDYMSTVPTGAAELHLSAKSMIVGGDGNLYITNYNKVARFNGTTLSDNVLDLPTGTYVKDIVWYNNRIYVITYRFKTNTSRIYIWDGVSPSWDYEITVDGLITTVLLINSIIYVWWGNTFFSPSPFNFIGYLSESLNLIPLKRYVAENNVTPVIGTVTDYRDYLLWRAGNDKILALGVNDPSSFEREQIVKLFSAYKSKHSALIGAIAAPYGNLFVASQGTGAERDISYATGYSKEATYKTANKRLGDGATKGVIKKVVIYTDVLATGAKMDTTIRHNAEASSKALAQIAYSATANRTKHTIFDGDLPVEDFSLEFSWAAGSATNPVAIKDVYIEGEYIEDLS